MSGRPEKTEAPAVGPPRDIRWVAGLGLAAILIAFGGFGGWAATAPLASAVIASGTVSVESKRKAVQHLDGGMVDELLVTDGDAVDAGQVLLRLDEAQARASLAILETAYFAAAAVEARLIAERDGTDTVAFPDELLARADKPEIAAMLAAHRELHDTRSASLRGQILVLQQRIGQLEEQIGGLEAQQRAVDAQLGLIREEVDALQGLFERGYASKPRILALRREAADLEGERGALIAEIARARSSIGESQLQIIQSRTAFREAVMNELRTVQAQVLDLRERVLAARDVLGRLELRAPVTGTVVGLSVHTVGGVVQPGDTVMEIVPTNDRLIVEARVSPLDIDSVVVGQAAKVNFSAFKQRSTPTLEGEVIYVSADSFDEPRTGESFFVTRVAVGEAEVARLGNRELQPGMPADVMILTGERTALRYLVEPIVDSMNRAWREE